MYELKKPVIIGGIAALFIIVGAVLFFPSFETVPKDPFTIGAVWFAENGEFVMKTYAPGDTIAIIGALTNFAQKNRVADIDVSSDILTASNKTIENRHVESKLTNGSNKVIDFSQTQSLIGIPPGLYYMRVHAIDNLRKQDSNFIIPFYVETPQKLSFSGPYLGTFNKDTVQFVKESKTYKVGDLVDMYLEVYGFTNPFHPDVTVYLAVADTQKKFYGESVIAQFNGEYTELSDALTVNFNYDTADLVQGTYYLRVRAIDANNNQTTEKYLTMVLT